MIILCEMSQNMWKWSQDTILRHHEIGPGNEERGTMWGEIHEEESGGGGDD